jgi:hypothetical protein
MYVLPSFRHKNEHSREERLKGSAWPCRLPLPELISRKADLYISILVRFPVARFSNLGQCEEFL